MTDDDGRGTSGDPTPTIAKPDALLALHDVTTELFATLRDWFDVPETVTLDLQEVDSAVTELGDPVLIAAMAMRKLQALHLLATPGVLTSTDVVVTMVGDLDRALLQAPTMHLRRRAEHTDWDAELARLDRGDLEAGAGAEAPEGADAGDPAVERFRMLHGRLHLAVQEVLDASGGDICYLV